MDFVEIFVGPFISVLLDRLIPGNLMQLTQSARIGSQLEKCRNTLVQIQAVVNDAEQKQMTDRNVLDWLDSLRVLAYDTDNVLDDLATEAMHRKLNEESEASTSKVRKLFTTFSPRTISYGGVIGSKLDEIEDRLNKLVEEKTKLGLNVNVETSIRGLETSLADEPMVVGREGDKEALLKKLLADETGNQNVEIVAIVGMGGVGKTKIAQMLFYDDNVKGHFGLKGWVCVSDEFDIFKISKVIFQAVTGDHRDFADLNSLQVALQNGLSKKKFLLVLDDVWNEKTENWERLQRPFQAGAPGSKIIVTTRSQEVVSTMGGVQPYLLSCLSDDESLALFAQHALGEGDFDKHPTLKSYGVGIVSKCKGLPLALRTLGRALSATRNDEDWKDLLNSEIWKSEEDKRVKILPALRLSFHHLPSYLKKLFAYCSLFPKDYVFDKDELVLLWMAEGFLQELKLNGNKALEDAGVKCFRELLSRSFFQRSPNDELCYVIHDLMNDLAKNVAGELFFRLDEMMNAEERIEDQEKLHHISFLRQRYGVYKKFEAFGGAKRLRTFLPVSVNLQTWQEFYLSNKVLVVLLPQLQFLRVLSLSRYRSIREVPDSICDLKHLRYLNFSHTRITCLPERVSQLYNLQSLLMQGCEELEKLPVSFAKLINLRHLDISDTPKLKKMPLGIGGLTSLQTLSKVIVQGNDGFTISELKDLKALRGRLSIKGLHKVVKEIHAKEANLLQNKGLEHLELEWSDEFGDSHMEATEYKVLEALRPHSKLRKLEIVLYGGNEFPNWVGDPSFVGLIELTLDSCRNCKSLPSVGHLPSLRKLIVKSMVAVKTIGPEFLGTSNSSPVIVFRLLEVLEFRNMQGWEKWSINGVVNSVFPHLLELRIQDCPKLGEVSIQSLPSLGVLRINGCQEVVLRSVVEVTSCVTRLYIRNVVGLSQLDGGMIGRLGAVEDLDILDCKELRYLWGSLAEACRILVKLRKLEVTDCGELVCLGEREKEEGGNWGEGNNLTSLRELNVWSCPKMEYLFGKVIEEEKESLSSSIFPHLEYLLIVNCSGMKSLFSTAGGGGQKLPSTLKRLSIYFCENLFLEESVVGIGGGEGVNCNSTLSSSSSLENLVMSSWPNSKLFLERGGREGRFIHLTGLLIGNCEGIESFPKMTTTTTATRGGGGGGFLPKGLRSLSIWNCKNVKSFHDEELQSLTSLVRLRIYNCPSMDWVIPRGLWPPNLSELRIGGLKKPISEWGPQNFPTSLVDLSLIGDESVAEVVGTGSSSRSTPTTTLHLPTCLSMLELSGFKNLESISKDLQHLTSLKELIISNCPKLRDLPETLLPSLSRLHIYNCPKLKERCITRRTRRDSYYPLISGIPHVEIDEKDLFESSQ